MSEHSTSRGGEALWAILGSHPMPTSCFKNGTILTTITSTTSIHKGKATTATINAKKTSTLFLPVTYTREGISASRRARELILGSNWGRIQFPIHWCTLQVWWPHQGRTLTVERSPLSALVTKLAFLVSIGWQPIVGGLTNERPGSGHVI